MVHITVSEITFKYFNRYFHMGENSAKRRTRIRNYINLCVGKSSNLLQQTQKRTEEERNPFPVKTCQLLD